MPGCAIPFATSGSLGKCNPRDKGSQTTEIAAREAQSRAASRWTDSFASCATFSSWRRFRKNASRLTKKLSCPDGFARRRSGIIVVHEKQLLAALEFKSQIGPSFGNNFNNRTEEALGSATDIWAAYREGAFKPSSRPFLGYLMLLEDCDRSRSPVRPNEPHFGVFPEFKTASYQGRYAILMEKLLRDRLYDIACFLLSTSASAVAGDYVEPHPELTFSKFVTPLVAHVAAICNG